MHPPWTILKDFHFVAACHFKEVQLKKSYNFACLFASQHLQNTCHHTGTECLLHNCDLAVPVLHTQK